MSIKNRVIKLEQKLLPKTGHDIEVIVCDEDETSAQACKRLDIDRDDGKFRIAVVFG